MDSSSSSWQKRIKAPEGFPWNGNIIKALNELNDIELPRELETAVRYYPDKDNENNKDPYEEFEKESLVNDNKENNTDNLDILLSDEEENEDDGLDSFLSDDIEEYNKDKETKNNIQDKLNDIMNSENDEDNLDQLLDDDDEDYINNLF